MDDEIKQQSRFLKAVIDSVPDYIFYKDLTSNYLGCNRTFAEKFVGIEEKDIIGKSDLDIIEDLELANFCRQGDLEAIETGKARRNEKQFTMANGKVIDVEIIKTAFCDEQGKVAGVIGISRDITERKRIENHLKKNKVWLELATNSGQINLWEWCMVSGKIKFNDGWKPLTGYTSDELAPLSIDTLLNLTDPKDVEKALENLEKCLVGEVDYYECETRLKHKDGSSVWVLHRGKIVDWDEDKKPLRMAGIHVDITRRKQEEEKLRAECSLFMGGPTVVLLWQNEQDCPVEYVSPNVYEILGYRPEDLTSGKVSYPSIVHPDDFAKMVTEAIMHTKKKKPCFELEYRIITARGAIRWFLNFVVVKRDLLGRVTHFHGYMNDITERKLLENKIAHIDRLNAIGEVAAGIAHEVRNPMTTVRGYLQFLQMKEGVTQYHNQFGMMIKELDQANAIITEFLSLAKNKPVEKKRGSLNNVLQALLPILQTKVSEHGHQLSMQLGELPDWVFDEKEIEQLVINMVSNGLDAIAEKGQVTITTSCENSTITLAIQDTGSGIATEILEKLGTPFLTTKQQGTGLGLSVCYGIVARHGGSIDVDTSAEGTTFTITFN